MNSSNNDLLPPITLEYKKGDLIVKEGDYGISIYKVVKGKVEVFIQSEGEEHSIATLGRDEIIGEMIFLKGYKTRRTASVRALEHSTLEAWHPDRISKEYEDMPFIIKHITKQSVDHLIRIDEMISGLAAKIEQEKTQKKPLRSKENQRKAFRKEIEMKCLYRPIDSTERVRLWGSIKNISKNGCRLDIRKINTYDHSHNLGDEFFATAYIPNGKEIEVRLRVANLRISEDNKTVSLGLEFVEINKDAEIALGFLLI